MWRLHRHAVGLNTYETIIVHVIYFVCFSIFTFCTQKLILNTLTSRVNTLFAELFVSHLVSLVSQFCRNLNTGFQLNKIHRKAIQCSDFTEQRSHWYPILTKLLKSVQDVLKGPIAHKVNKSLALSTKGWKDAISKPFLKKQGPKPSTFPNHRLVGNLPNTGKTWKRPLRKRR